MGMNTAFMLLNDQAAQIANDPEALGLAILPMLLHGKGGPIKISGYVVGHALPSAHMEVLQRICVGENLIARAPLDEKPRRKKT